MELKIQGFHGTSFDNAKSIIRDDFKLSIGDEEWLGDGVYFFVKGLSDKPQEQAQKWAIAQSWDKNRKSNKYKRYSVIRSEIAVDEENFLDLTTSNGIGVFEYIIEHHISKMRKIGKRINYIDGFVINFARGEGLLPIEVAKGNFYIKFSKERIEGIDRRTPNRTICSVFEPSSNISNNELVLTNEID